MRAITFLYLFLILAACAAPGPTTEELRMPTDTPLKPLAQPTSAPTLVPPTATPTAAKEMSEPSKYTVQPTLVQPTAAPSAATPAAAPKFESSVPLLLWNEAQSRYELHPVDPTTGQDVSGYSPIITSKSAQFAEPTVLSTDGKKLAIVAANGEYCYATGGGIACMGRAAVLHLIDLQNWREVTATLPGKGWAGPISFSPDTTRLALIYNEPNSSAVMLFDTRLGHLVAHQGITFPPSLMGYAQDGTTLALYGQPSSALTI